MPQKSVYKKIQLDDSKKLHRELSIYREGTIHHINIQDESHVTYASLAISAHNYAALFHYGIIERLNALPFISETNNGLDSWDEAILPHAMLNQLTELLTNELKSLEQKEDENIMLGWVEKPEKISFWRQIHITEFRGFMTELIVFCNSAITRSYDIEFIL